MLDPYSIVCISKYMLSRRRATKQIAFRAEATIAAQWFRFVEDSLIPNRAHVVCAMLLYMWSGAQRRSVAQRAYARFCREDRLERPPELAAGQNHLSAKELELLSAYRNACERVREQVIAGLVGHPASPAATPGEPATGETCPD